MNEVKCILNAIEEAGRWLGRSRATAYRNWDFAKAWLRCAIEQSDGL